MNDLESFWANMLSRDPERILFAWGELSDEEQQAVYEHLLRMTSEDGWADAQRVSAQTALDTIDKDAQP